MFFFFPFSWGVNSLCNDVSQVGVCFKEQRSDWWRASVGGLRTNTTICGHRRTENPSLELSDSSGPIRKYRLTNQKAFWHPAANSVTTHWFSVCVVTGDMVGFAVPRRSGSYVAGVGRSVVAVDWPTGEMTSLVQVDHDKPNNRLNDGKVDPAGRLLGGR